MRLEKINSIDRWHEIAFDVDWEVADIQEALYVSHSRSLIEGGTIGLGEEPSVRLIVLLPDHGGKRFVMHVACIVAPSDFAISPQYSFEPKIKHIAQDRVELCLFLDGPQICARQLFVGWLDSVQDAEKLELASMLRGQFFIETDEDWPPTG